MSNVTAHISPGDALRRILPLLVAPALAAAVIVFGADQGLHPIEAGENEEYEPEARRAGPPELGATEPPSIVLILADDQRADTLSVMSTVRNEIAAKGVSFRNAFVSNSLCCPSRTTLLTGNYSHMTGVYGNRAPYGGFYSFRDSNTLATWLDTAGYTTALVGKYLNDYTTAYIPPGWDEWVAFLDPVGYYDYRLNVNGRLISHGGRPKDYATDVLANHAVNVIRRAQGPLFLMFAPYAPHAPALPPPRYGDRALARRGWSSPALGESNVSDKPAYIRDLRPMGARGRAEAQEFRARQLAALAGVDDAVARILAALEATGRLDNTLIIYTSDNGVSWGEHQLSPERKLVPYEGAIRVPLVVRYDPMTMRGRHEERMVLNTDLAPTIASVAGLEIPPTEGMSFLSMLAEKETADWRSDFLLEHLRRSGRGLKHPDVPTYCGVRSERHTYVLYETGEEELYDLRRDPYQLENIAGDPASKLLLQTLRVRLRELCAPAPPGFDPSVLCTIEGTSEDDLIHGSGGRDYICGHGGRDIVRGGAGGDTITVATEEVSVRALAGGTGAGTTIVAGSGDDRIVTQNGKSDRVRCGPGSDLVVADHFDRIAGDCEVLHRDLGMPNRRR